MVPVQHENARKVFKKLGTCSRTFTYILNHEFGNHAENEEKAMDPLAGGIFQKGYQCGMLWGSVLAIGAESYRRYGKGDKSTTVALKASQQIMNSFTRRTGTISCREITRCDFSSTWSFAKYFFSGRYLNCFKLAEKWAPEAIETAKNALDENSNNGTNKVISCAAKVARKMGAGEKESAMVAGFAGGMGLSGSGCGALGAALWLNTLEWCKDNDEKSAFKNPKALETLEKFEHVTGSKFLCSEICGRRFKTNEDHTEFIRNGGCKQIINVLSEPPN